MVSSPPEVSPMTNLFDRRRWLTRVLLTVFLVALSAAGAMAAEDAAPSSPQDVLTFHNDNYRTGWFSSETTLTPANVNASSFGLLKVVTLDGRSDTEPLFVSGVTIPGKGVHDVV